MPDDSVRMVESKLVRSSASRRRVGRGVSLVIAGSPTPVDLGGIRAEWVSQLPEAMAAPLLRYLAGWAVAALRVTRFNIDQTIAHVSRTTSTEGRYR
jgi:hypothetical protein